MLYTVEPYKLNYPEKNFNLKKLQLLELNNKLSKLIRKQLLLIPIPNRDFNKRNNTVLHAYIKFSVLAIQCNFA